MNRKPMKSGVKSMGPMAAMSKANKPRKFDRGAIAIPAKGSSFGTPAGTERGDIKGTSFGVPKRKPSMPVSTQAEVGRKAHQFPKPPFVAGFGKARRMQPK
jgi:hypothetical protein